MEVRPAFNYLWTTGFTGLMSGYAILRQLPGADPDLFQRHTRSWAQTLIRGLGVEVRAVDADRLDPAATYVLMANHQSHIDIPALLSSLPMVPGFLAKAELRKVPLFGRAMEAGGHVFVDRGRHDRAVEAIARAAADIRRGGSIVIFPEGTRSRRREVLPFKKGGFHLAKQAAVPVVPIGLRGTADILPKHEKAIRPGRVEIHVGAPIEPQQFEEQSVDDLLATVRETICRLAALPPASDRSGA